VLVVMVVAIFVLGGFGFVALQGRDSQYVAEALIVLQDPNTEDGGSSTRFVAEQVQIMGSPIVAEAASSHIEDEYGLVFTSSQVLGATQISSSQDSTLVTLGAVSDEPDEAIALVNGLANGYQEVADRQSTQTSVAALERIDAQIQALEERFNEVSAGIQAERDANEELRRLETQFQEALTLIANLQGDLETADEEEAEEIRSDIADLQLRIQNYQQALTASRTSPELQALLEEQTQLINRRTELTQRRDQIAIDAELAPGAVALLQPAEQAAEFNNTSLTRIMAVALALGVIVAFGLAYLLELRRRRFRDRLEPQAILSRPLLADIPSFEDEHLKSVLPVRESPASAAAEGFRFAAAAIQEAMRNRNAKTVLMISSTVGHGKSTSIVNTAMADARRGHSVLLMDCDFGTQDAARLALGAEPVTRSGLVDVLEDGVQFYKALTNLSLGEQASLSLLGQGTRPAGAANLGSDYQELLERASDEFDAVFVDSPPLLQVAYASTLANQVDALVVVVSHGTPVREMEDLVDRLQLIDTPVLGYIYNRSPLRREMTRREGSMRNIFEEDSTSTGGSRSKWIPEWARR
jgi:Mrp family chromosome partitioning ATPase/capsular polysaccharide biosynthesis protein